MYVCMRYEVQRTTHNRLIDSLLFIRFLALIGFFVFYQIGKLKSCKIAILNLVFSLEVKHKTTASEQVASNKFKMSNVKMSSIVPPCTAMYHHVTTTFLIFTSFDTIVT